MKYPSSAPSATNRTMSLDCRAWQKGQRRRAADHAPPQRWHDSRRRPSSMQVTVGRHPSAPRAEAALPATRGKRTYAGEPDFEGGTEARLSEKPREMAGKAQLVFQAGSVRSVRETARRGRSSPRPTMRQSGRGPLPRRDFHGQPLHQWSEQLFERLGGDDGRRVGEERHAPRPALPAFLLGPPERYRSAVIPVPPAFEHGSPEGERVAHGPAAPQHVLPLAHESLVVRHDQAAPGKSIASPA